MKPKLYFKYGTMSSSKSANLLMINHNYKKQGKKALLVKPNIDNRDGVEYISSRAGFKELADIIVDNKTNLYEEIYDKIDKYDCVLVDESQFLSIDNVLDLRKITKFIPVICYGLKTDYKCELFTGSKCLLEVADKIEEIKTICVNCNSKAIVNAKYLIDNNGKKNIIKSSSKIVDVGGDELYQPMCWVCWNN